MIVLIIYLHIVNYILLIMIMFMFMF